MILLRDETPVIELAGGSIPLDSAWLQSCLEKAARAAGYSSWWPAGDVAKTVTHFLRSERLNTPLSFEKFTSSVRRALEGIGYAEVAPYFLRDGVDLSFSLLEVAESTGPGFEMGFFRGCKQACQRMLSTGVAQRLALEDLEPAIKFVVGHAHWSPRCQRLADELVDYLRHHLPLLGPRQTLYFSLR
jgi:hypothetical protein